MYSLLYVSWFDKDFFKENIMLINKKNIRGLRFHVYTHTHTHTLLRASNYNGVMAWAFLCNRGALIYAFSDKEGTPY